MPKDCSRIFAIEKLAGTACGIIPFGESRRISVRKIILFIVQHVFRLWNFCIARQNVFFLYEIISRLAQLIFRLWNFCTVRQDVFFLYEIISLVAQRIFDLWIFCIVRKNVFSCYEIISRVAQHVFWLCENFIFCPKRFLRCKTATPLCFHSPWPSDKTVQKMSGADFAFGLSWWCAAAYDSWLLTWFLSET